MGIETILTSAIIFIPPLLIAMVLHELAHAVVAKRLGDLTSYMLGRITLNPIKHIDPVWTVLIPVMLIVVHSPVVFGAARPVPVNPMNFKDPRRDMLWVALAGPVVNMILFIVSILLYILLAPHLDPNNNSIHELILMWISQSCLINLVLALFNLIPVPPLDGGRIVTGLLPEKLAYSYAELERYGFIIVIGMLALGIFDAFFRFVVLLSQSLVDVPVIGYLCRTFYEILFFIANFMPG